MRTPAECYTPSPRLYPVRLPEPEYPAAMRVRSVFGGGQFFWNYHHLFLSKVLAGERIGLFQISDRYWHIYFAAFPSRVWTPFACVWSRWDRRTQNTDATARADGNVEISNPRRFPHNGMVRRLIRMETGL